MAAVHTKMRLFAFSLSLLVLASALSIMWYARQFQTEADPKLLVRPIQVTSMPLPPPPPPPAPNQPAQQSQLDIQISANSSVTLPLPPDIVLAQPKMDIPTLQPQVQQLKWQSLQMDISAFGLDQLDALPVLQTPLNAVFPRSLSRQGVKSALVKVDILIDENGKPTLLDIVENPYPELRPEIERVVRGSRFSMPTKDNAAVSARFIWPVEFKP